MEITYIDLNLYNKDNKVESKLRDFVLILIKL